VLSARGHFITILDAYRDKRSLTFEGDFERYGLFSTVIFPSGSTTAILVLDCWNMSAMLSDTSFPLYVFEKDDWSMFLVEREEKLLYHIDQSISRMMSTCFGMRRGAEYGSHLNAER
jgi:hypothetical protein